jgi:hypothetical protein
MPSRIQTQKVEEEHGSRYSQTSSQLVILLSAVQ